MVKRNMKYQEVAASQLRSVFCLALAISAVAALALPVLAPPRLAAQIPVSAPAPAPVPRGDLAITVSAPDGHKKFEDCTVIARDQILTFGAEKGPKTMTGVPANPEESVAVTAEARVAQGAGKPVLRFVGVTEVSPEAGKTVKVTVKLKPADDINAYCVTCHPGRGQRARPGQIRRDTHNSGQPLEGRYADQVRLYNERVAQLIKEGKPHGEPIVVEERLVKVGAKEVKKTFYTCESCHTLHKTTANPKYTRAPYLEKSDLCTGCHY